MGIVYMVEDLFKRSDTKWEAVKEYYERTYQIRFKAKPLDHIIEDLYKRMHLLASELHDHQEKKRLMVPYRK